VQETKFLLFFRVKFSTFEEHFSQDFHSILLFRRQIALNIFVFLKKLGQLCLLLACHGLLEESHC
jgi:hypothetical protein